MALPSAHAGTQRKYARARAWVNRPRIRR